MHKKPWKEIKSVFLTSCVSIGYFKLLQTIVRTRSARKLLGLTVRVWVASGTLSSSSRPRPQLCMLPKEKTERYQRDPKKGFITHYDFTCSKHKVWEIEMYLEKKLRPSLADIVKREELRETGPHNYAVNQL